MMTRQLVPVLAAVALSGCYSMQGSERILNRDGYITQEVSQNSIFANDFKNAFKARGGKIPGENTNAGQNDQSGTEGTDHDKPDHVKNMLSSGFTHIYSYCDGYFDQMGIRQRKSRVTRDAIAPISALITGVLALHSFEKNPGRKEDLLAVLGLTTAATSSALDIYDEHMLFGAENIGAVETLTKAALSAHSERVLAFQSVSFDAGIRHLLDNQALCSPQQILLLAREAIRKGKPVADGGGEEGEDETPRPEPGGDENSPTPQPDGDQNPPPPPPPLGNGQGADSDVGNKSGNRRVEITIDDR